MALPKRFVLPLIASFTIALALFDFTAFCQRTAALTAPAAPSADAIIVLTGGSGLRIAAGIDLLKAGAAPQMLISGVNPDVPEAEIIKLGGGEAELYACCVTLGRQAQTTIGNGEETSNWVREQASGKLLIVTSNYHMPRAMIVLSRAMPNLDLTPFPIQSSLNPGSPFASLTNTRGLAIEWGKWRITRLLNGNTASL